MDGLRGVQSSRAAVIVRIGLGGLMLRFVESWAILPAAFGVALLMNNNGLGFALIYGTLVVLDYLWAVVILGIQSGTATDITLMKTTGTVALWLDRYPLGRYLFEVVAVIWTIFWSGPAYLYTFLERYGESVRSRKHRLLLAAAALQMVPWTLIYITGVNSLSELW